MNEEPGTGEPARSVEAPEASLAGPLAPTDESARAVTAQDAAVSTRSDRSRRPDWFHRGHPVFYPLAGFFTGMISIIVVPGIYVAVVKSIAGYERVGELIPFMLLLLAVPIGMLVPRRTRRFARYMLLGMVLTLVVVLGVAAAVLWFLLKRDS